MSSVPGKVRPLSHFSPFGSLSAFSSAAAMTLAGDGCRWWSSGKGVSAEREKRREGAGVLQNVHSFFLHRVSFELIPLRRYRLDI